MRKLGYVLAVSCLLASGNMAMAGLSPVEDPFPAGSWGQQFNESGVGPYDQMIIKFVAGPGGPLESPAFTAFSVGGWASGPTVNGIASAVGPDTSNMNFNILFQGTNADSLTFHFWALLDGVTLEGAQAVWNGNWTITPLASSAPPAPAVPEPLTAAAAFFAIGGLGGYIRRRSGRSAA